jgi:hypothetical protein
MLPPFSVASVAVGFLCVLLALLVCVRRAMARRVKFALNRELAFDEEDSIITVMPQMQHQWGSEVLVSSNGFKTHCA